MTSLFTALASGANAQNPALPQLLTGDDGVSIMLLQPARRVVSLLPSLSETVCNLGACERLVGVDRYSNHPPRLSSVPKLGGGLDPNLEAVLALKPDLVLAATSTRGLARLRAAGAAVLALEPRNIAQFLHAQRLISRALNIGNPELHEQIMEFGLATAAALVPPPARSAKVYVEVGPGPYAAGPQSFVGELLQQLKLINVIDASLGVYPKISPEYVVRANPDLIVVVEGDARALRRRPGWGAIAAVRSGRICGVSAQDSDLLMRAGPRVTEAAAVLSRCTAQHWPETRP